jgi:hypothetical protein
MEIKTPQDQDRLAWHPAFITAVQLDLKPYLDKIEILPEFPLTSEPLKIDCIIIKKEKGLVINRNFAAFFRDWNIMEYKSPEAYVSINDYQKVYAYACLFSAFKNVPVGDITISFVQSRYPRKLIDFLRKARNYTVEETSPGIYTIKGDVIAIQIIDSRKLSSDENLWLKNLRRKLDKTAIDKAIVEREKHFKSSNYDAYFDVIFRANPEVFKEVMEMRGAPSLIQLVLETKVGASYFAEAEARLRAEGEARGRAEGCEAVARNALAQGLTPELVQKITGLDMQTITSLCPP